MTPLHWKEKANNWAKKTSKVKFYKNKMNFLIKVHKHNPKFKVFVCLSVFKYTHLTVHLNPVIFSHLQILKLLK